MHLKFLLLYFLIYPSHYHFISFLDSFYANKCKCECIIFSFCTQNIKYNINHSMHVFSHLIMHLEILPHTCAFHTHTELCF